MEDRVNTVGYWRSWINDIVADPEMDTDRVIRHIQHHIANHMPNEDATQSRWEEWLSGTYNLMAILCASLGIEPTYEYGLSKLLEKHEENRNNTTPPPAIIPANFEFRKLSWIRSNESRNGG